MKAKRDWLRPFEGSAALRRTGARALAVVFGTQSIKFLLGTVGTLILVRILSPEDFGIAAMTAVFLNLIVVFKDFGLGTATIQSSTLTQSQASTIFWMVQAGGFFLTVLGIIAAPHVAEFFDEPRLESALTLISAGFSLSSLGAQHSALLSRDLRFTVLGAIEIVALLAGLTSGIFLAMLGYGWWSLIWQRLLQIAIGTIGVWLVCSWRPSASLDIHGSKGQLALGAHVSAASVAGYVSRNADNVLVGWYWGATSLGYYSKAYDLLMAPLAQIAAPFGQALQPVLGRLRDDSDRYGTMVLHAITASMLVLMPVGLIMFWRAETLTVVLLGESWLKAAPVIGWFGLLVCFHLCGSVLTWSLITRHRGRDLSRTTVINTVVNLLGFAASVPFGITAVAATYTLLGLFVRTPYFLYISSRDQALPTDGIIRALMLPTLVFGTLSAAGVLSWKAGLMDGLNDWQSLCMQLVFGYLIIFMVIAPTRFGRFVFETVRAVRS